MMDQINPNNSAGDPRNMHKTPVDFGTGMISTGAGGPTPTGAPGGNLPGLSSPGANTPGTNIPGATTPNQQPASQQPLAPNFVNSTPSAPSRPNLLTGVLGGFKSIFGKGKTTTTTGGVTTSKTTTQLSGTQDNQAAPQAQALTPDLTLQDVIAPSWIEIDFNDIQIGDKFYRTLVASGYPRFVGPNWLSPLINFEHSLTISTFYYPVDSKDTLQKLKRKISEMEASLMGDAQKGVVLDPTMKISLSDAQKLQESIAAGTEKFFHFSMYITIVADSKVTLEKISKNVISTLAAINVTARPESLKMEQAFLSCLPTGSDNLYVTRNMDTTSLATTFPFVTSDLTMDHGVLYGLNMHNRSLIVFDRFEMENANSVIFAKAGAGKSYFVKLEALRSLMLGTEIIVIDPEKEFERLCDAVDGAYVTFSQDKGSKINPFELSGTGTLEEDELRMKILALHGFFKVIFGGLNNIENSILDRALILTYREKGITMDPETQKGAEPPLLEDLYKILQGMAENEAHEMARRLEKYIMGSAAGVFNEKSNIAIENAFTVFSLRDLQEELRPMAMYLMLDYIWTKVRKDQKRRILIVDEAWLLMQYEDSAKFLYSIAKRARKYYLGLTTITQDVEDFLSTDFGKAVVTNSSMQMLLKQSPAAINKIQQVFNLSDGEKNFILSCDKGEGIFFAGANHVAMRIIASMGEHMLITTNPKEVAKMKEKDTKIDQKEITELAKVYDPLKFQNE